MPINPDKLWAQMARGLRRKLGLQPLTYEEGTYEYESVKEVPLTYDEVQFLTDFACSYGDTQPQPNEDAFEKLVDLKQVADEMAVLHRNEGKKDQPVENRLCALRKIALEKKHASSKEENADGVDRGKKSTGKGEHSGGANS